MSAETLAPARRRSGVNLEKWGWVFMRVSGVVLVVLIFGHLISNLLVGDGIHALDFAFIAGKFATPFWQWWDVLMLWLALIHGANGMRTIVNDHVINPRARKALVWAMSGSIALLASAYSYLALYSSGAQALMLGALFTLSGYTLFGFVSQRHTPRTP